MKYIVTATFKLHAGERDQFIEKIAVHAAASLSEEGCSVFDVCQSEDDPDTFLLYEAYRDFDAYLQHRETAHYGRFRKWAPPMLVLKDGEIFQTRNVWQGAD